MKNSINAFRVSAKISDELWNSKATTLVASSQDDAIAKAKEVLNLKPEHVITVEEIEVFSTSSKLTTDDYPYGRLRATAYFSVEYNKRGARTVFQTINPKTNRVNKPKNSTYYKVILPYQASNGHYEFCGYLDFNGTSSLNKGLRFMSDFYELFTIDQIKDVAITALAGMKANLVGYVQYSGSDIEAVKPLMSEQISTLVKIAQTGENLFSDCFLDEKAMDATKQENYRAFKVTSHNDLLTK